MAIDRVWFGIYTHTMDHTMDVYTVFQCTVDRIHYYMENTLDEIQIIYYMLHSILYLYTTTKKIILPNGIKHTHIRLPIAMVAIA